MNLTLSEVFPAEYLQLIGENLNWKMMLPGKCKRKTAAVA